MGSVSEEKETMGYVKLVLGWLIFLVFLPILFIVFFPLKIWKTIVVAYVRYTRPDYKALLTAYDSIFAVDKYFDTAYAGNVTMFVVEGHLSLEEMREGFIRQVLSKETDNGEKLYDRLFQVPTSFGGYYFWRELQTLDLSKQIRVAHQFTSNDHQNELHAVLAKLMTNPFPDALWELLLYRGFENDKTVVVFRIHHTLGDGYTFNHLVDEMLQASSQYMVKTPPANIAEKVQLLKAAPLRIASLYQHAFNHGDCFTKRKVNEHGVVSITTIPLDVMKAVRRKTNSHFATVGMSLLAGALRRYYKEMNRPVPEYVSIMHSLPKPGHPLTTMCNHWGVGLFKIPLDTTSALDRLQRSEFSFNQYMTEQYDQLIHSHIPLFCLLPRPFLELFFSTNFGTGIGFTSVPAYDKPATLWGHRVLNMHKLFGLQWRQSAVAAAVYTHNGQASYTIFANKDIVPDQAGTDKVTREHLHAELNQLIKELGLQIPPTAWNNNQLSTSPPPRAIRTEGFA